MPVSPLHARDSRGGEDECRVLSLRLVQLPQSRVQVPSDVGDCQVWVFRPFSWDITLGTPVYTG